MPKIPTFKRTRVFPGSAGGALMDVSQAGRVAGAVRESSEDIADLGSSMVRVAGALRRRDEEIRKRDEALERSVTAMKIENELSGELDQLKGGFLKRRDYRVFEESAEKDIDALYPKYQQRAGDDQRLGLAIERAFSTHKAKTLSWVRDRKRQVLVEEGQGEFEVSYEKSVNDWAAAGTEEERTAIKSFINLKAELFAKEGVLSPKAVSVYMDQFDDRVFEAYTKSLINTNAVEAVRILKDKEFLQGFDPIKREDLLSRALGKAEVEKEGERNKQETHVYNRLHSRFNGNPQRMRAALFDPKVQKELGIDLKQVKSVEAAISSYEKVQKARIDKIEGVYAHKFYQEQQLDTDEILQDLRAWYRNPMDGIDKDTAMFWLGEIKRKDEETDDQTFNSLHDAISRKDPKVTRGVIARTRGLKREHKTHLVEMFDADVRRELSNALTQAKLILKLEIFGSEEISNLPDPRAPGRLMKAYLALSERALNFIKEGKVWDITAAKEHTKLVSDLVALYRYDRVKVQESLIEDSKEMRKRIKKRLREPEEEERPRTIDEYERSKRAD